MPIVEAVGNTSLGGVRGARPRLLQAAMAKAIEDAYAEAAAIAVREDLTHDEKVEKQAAILNPDNLRVRINEARARAKAEFR